MAMNAEQREADLIRYYVDTHEFAAITIADPGGLATIKVAAPLDWDVEHAGIWWLADHEKAAALVASIPQGLQVDDAIRLVLLYAERARLRLTEHATLLDRGRGAVALVEERIRNMQAKGDMRGLNVEYQDHRLFNKERGRGVQPYWAWLHDRKREMVKAVALTASGRRPHNPPPPAKLDDLPPKAKRKNGGLRMLKTTHMSFGRS